MPTAPNVSLASDLNIARDARRSCKASIDLTRTVVMQSALLQEVLEALRFSLEEGDMRFGNAHVLVERLHGFHELGCELLVLLVAPRLAETREPRLKRRFHVTQICIE